jgi:predicted nuclease with TOPRIM domain
MNDTVLSKDSVLEYLETNGDLESQLATARERLNELSKKTSALYANLQIAATGFKKFQQHPDELQKSFLRGCSDLAFECFEITERI